MDWLIGFGLAYGLWALVALVSTFSLHDTVSRKSWHVRFIDSVYEDWPWSKCAYFWKLLWAPLLFVLVKIIATLVVAWRLLEDLFKLFAGYYPRHGTPHSYWAELTSYSRYALYEEFAFRKQYLIGLAIIGTVLWLLFGYFAAYQVFYLECVMETCGSSSLAILGLTWVAITGIALIASVVVVIISLFLANGERLEDFKGFVTNKFCRRLTYTD